MTLTRALETSTPSFPVIRSSKVRLVITFCVSSSVLIRVKNRQTKGEGEVRLLRYELAYPMVIQEEEERRSFDSAGKKGLQLGN